MPITAVRRRRRRSRLGFVVVPVSVIGAAVLVAATSYSVFTAAATSPGNTWTTGSVSLTNDSSGSQSASGSALFTNANSGNLGPGGSGITQCVTVRSGGTTASAIRMYASNGSQTNSLLSYLNVVVEIGSATSTSGGACTGWSATSTIATSDTLQNFRTAHTGFANGVATGWTPNGSSAENRVFRITVTPSSSMTASQQNSTASLDFVWEANG